MAVVKFQLLILEETSCRNFINSSTVKGFADSVNIFFKKLTRFRYIFYFCK